MKRIACLCVLACGAGGWPTLHDTACAQVPSLREQLLWFDTATPGAQDSSGLPAARATRSPALAMGLSALLPGAGQVYAQRYWTIPIIYGMGAFLVYNWMEADDLYQRYKGEYEQSVAEGEYGGSGDPTLKSSRDFYRNERDRFGVYILLTYLLNIADAYVGASLFNFDVSEELAPARQFSITFSVPLR